MAIESQLSPKYRHDKLNDPSFQDLVDVFEDLWLNYIFRPVGALLSLPYGDVAAMCLLCSYFEATESLRKGESSDGRSKEFFVKGFRRVFKADHPEIEAAAKEIYKHIRNGLAHEGMLSSKVQFWRGGTKAFLVTYPKNADGSLDIGSGAQSIVVNAARMFEGVQIHFAEYVAALRSEADEDLCKAFKATVERQWSRGTGELVIGMTEAELLNGPQPGGHSKGTGTADES